MPSPRKKTSKRKEKSGRPPTTPENGGNRQYRKFKLRNKLIVIDEISRMRLMKVSRSSERISTRMESQGNSPNGEDKVIFLKQRCEALKITYDDIMNRIRSKEKKEAEKKKKNLLPHRTFDPRRRSWTNRFCHGKPQFKEQRHG